MTTFVALGDSISLGVGDPAPEGGWRGWAAFLAQSLPGGQLVNLAANGARAADVERTQLPRALELRPDMASVVVGINDTLRADFDAARIQGALAHVTGSLSAAGAEVLTMRLPDPGLMLGLPAALARPLGRRLQVINEAMDQVAERFGTLHFDAAADRSCYDRRMWSADRLHPSERGHRHLAGRFHDQLTARGHVLGPRPGTEPTSRPGWTRQPGWRPRAPAGYCAGAPTWCRTCSTWRYASAGQALVRGPRCSPRCRCRSRRARGRAPARRPGR